MKAADLLVRALEHEGVQFVFGIPGEENLEVLEALRQSSIKLVVTRHEAGAGFMAATVGRLTGKPGVALSTLGPGATNLLTAAAYAQLGAMPMFMLTGQKPIKSSKQGHFQIVDVVEAMGPVTKYSRQIVHGNTVAAHVREAFRLAMQERPGATHLELPEDTAEEQVSDDFLFPTNDIRRPAADEKAIRAAVAALEQAKRPLLLIGAGANRTMTSRMLQRLVDITGMPFFTTQMGKGVLDERQELCLGTAALSDGDCLHNLVDRADVILNVGHDVVEKPPFFMRPGGRTVIHVNYTPAEVDPVYFPQHQVIGDVANAVWQLGNGLGRLGAWDQGDFTAMKQRLERQRMEGADSNHFPVKPQRLVHDVRQAMPEDGIVALDNGMYKLWFARHYLAYQPNTLLLDNALASMGAGLPSAMAAALLYPDRAVLAVCGDGGLMMSIQELETAVRLQLNLVILVVRDDGFGMIRWKQHGMELPDYGLGFGNPDFVTLAQAFGVHGHRLSQASELLSTLQSCLGTGGVHLIDAPVDYSENPQFTRVIDED